MSVFENIPSNKDVEVKDEDEQSPWAIEPFEFNHNGESYSISPEAFNELIDLIECYGSRGKEKQKQPLQIYHDGDPAKLLRQFITMAILTRKGNMKWNPTPRIPAFLNELSVGFVAHNVNGSAKRAGDAAILRTNIVRGYGNHVAEL